MKQSAQSPARVHLLILVLALLVIGSMLGDTWVRAQASPYTLSWWTVDGGGGTLSGGGYTLSSTAGQPDAATWAGGEYLLGGGFWGVARIGEYALYLPLVLRQFGN